MPRATARGPIPVFVIGFPRAGTSLVERILGMHPEVHPAGELPDISALAGKPGPGNDRFPGTVLHLDADRLNTLAESHLRRLETLAAGASCVVDKMPHNFLFLGLILQLFPQARIVHVRRAPPDTCLSNFFQLFSSTLSYPYRLDTIAHQYHLYHTLMAHWRDCGIVMHELEYAALVTDQETVTRRLLDDLGLAWDPACLRFHDSTQVTRTASNLRCCIRSTHNRWDAGVTMRHT